MLLQGSLQEFSLPNILQLVKMSAKSGCLTIRREGETGRVFFRNGFITYATSSPQALPLGERLVKAGVIGKTQLKRALDAQRRSPDGARLGHVLLEGGDIDRETLEQAVREQIEDSVFTFFGWPDGEFQFGADESPSDEDILVELNVEHVIMEGCRRIDEWELIFQQLGSMERVPRLAYSDHVEEEGGLTLTAEEWRVVVHIDGHADINTILHECGLDRFRGAKVMYSLFSSGLVTVSEPVIEGIGRTLSVAVRGPIDTYNEVFISTLTDSDTVKQLRVETIDETEVEIPVLAGQMPANGNGEAEDDEGAAQDVLVFTVSSASPEEAWRRLAAELGLGAAGQRERRRQPALDPRRPAVRQASGRRALRRRPLYVHGRRGAEPQADRQDARPGRLDAGRALPVARPSVGRGGGARGPRPRRRARPRLTPSRRPPAPLVFARTGVHDVRRRRAAPGPARRKDASACTTRATA